MISRQQQVVFHYNTNAPGTYHLFGLLPESMISLRSIAPGGACLFHPTTTKISPLLRVVPEGQTSQYLRFFAQRDVVPPFGACLRDDYGTTLLLVAILRARPLSFFPAAREKNRRRAAGQTSRARSDRRSYSSNVGFRRTYVRTFEYTASPTTRGAV